MCLGFIILGEHIIIGIMSWGGGKESGGYV